LGFGAGGSVSAPDPGLPSAGGVAGDSPGAGVGSEGGGFTAGVCDVVSEINVTDKVSVCTVAGSSRSLM